MPLFLVDKGIVRVSLGEMELRKVETSTRLALGVLRSDAAHPAPTVGC